MGQHSLTRNVSRRREEDLSYRGAIHEFEEVLKEIGDNFILGNMPRVRWSSTLSLRKQKMKRRFNSCFPGPQISGEVHSIVLPLKLETILRCGPERNRLPDRLALRR